MEAYAAAAGPPLVAARALKGGAAGPREWHKGLAARQSLGLAGCRGCGERSGAGSGPKPGAGQGPASGSGAGPGPRSVSVHAEPSRSTPPTASQQTPELSWKSRLAAANPRQMGPVDPARAAPASPQTSLSPLCPGQRPRSAERCWRARFMQPLSPAPPAASCRPGAAGEGQRSNAAAAPAAPKPRVPGLAASAIGRTVGVLHKSLGPAEEPEAGSAGGGGGATGVGPAQEPLPSSAASPGAARASGADTTAAQNIDSSPCTPGLAGGCMVMASVSQKRPAWADALAQRFNQGLLPDSPGAALQFLDAKDIVGDATTPGATGPASSSTAPTEQWQAAAPRACHTLLAVLGSAVEAEVRAAQALHAWAAATGSLRASGALLVLPFAFPGTKAQRQAQEAVLALRALYGAVAVVDQGQLLARAELELTLAGAAELAEETAGTGAEAFLELLGGPQGELLGRREAEQGQLAPILCMGVGSGPCASDAVMRAMASPLLETVAARGLPAAHALCFVRKEVRGQWPLTGAAPAAASTDAFEARALQRLMEGRLQLRAQSKGGPVSLVSQDVSAELEYVCKAIPQAECYRVTLLIVHHHGQPLGEGSIQVFLKAQDRGRALASSRVTESPPPAPYIQGAAVRGDTSAPAASAAPAAERAGSGQATDAAREQDVRSVASAPVRESVPVSASPQQGIPARGTRRIAQAPVPSAPAPPPASPAGPGASQGVAPGQRAGAGSGEVRRRAIAAVDLQGASPGARAPQDPQGASHGGGEAHDPGEAEAGGRRRTIARPAAPEATSEGPTVGTRAPKARGPGEKEIEGKPTEQASQARPGAKVTPASDAGPGVAEAPKQAKASRRRDAPTIQASPVAPKQAKGSKRDPREATRMEGAGPATRPELVPNSGAGVGREVGREAGASLADQGEEAGAGAEWDSLGSAQRSQDEAAEEHRALLSLADDAAAPEPQPAVDNASGRVQAGDKVPPEQAGEEVRTEEPAESAAEDGARDGTGNGRPDSGASGSSAEEGGRDDSSGVEQRSPHSGVHIELLTAADLVRGTMPALQVEELLRKSRMEGALQRTVLELLLEERAPHQGGPTQSGEPRQGRTDSGDPGGEKAGDGWDGGDLGDASKQRFPGRAPGARRLRMEVLEGKGEGATGNGEGGAGRGPLFPQVMQARRLQTTTAGLSSAAIGRADGASAVRYPTPAAPVPVTAVDLAAPMGQEGGSAGWWDKMSREAVEGGAPSGEGSAGDTEEGAQSLRNRVQRVLDLERPGAGAGPLEGGTGRAPEEVTVVEKGYRGGVYHGTAVEGVPQGMGALSFASGALYRGGWQSGKRHGKGKFISSSNTQYYGYWQDDKRHGQGTMSFPNGDSLQGAWDMGEVSGWAVHSFRESGDVYEGWFLRNARHGPGFFRSGGNQVWFQVWSTGKLLVSWRCI